MNRIYHPPELWLQTIPYGQVTAVHVTGIDDRTRQGHLGLLIRRRRETYDVNISYWLPRERAARNVSEPYDICLVPHERAGEVFTDLLGSLADALSAAYRVTRTPTGGRETAYGFFSRRGLRATAKLPICDEHYRCADRLLHVLPTLNRPDVTLAYASGARAPRAAARRASGHSS